MRCSIRSQPRRGATTVEFALTAPLLFMVILAAIEFSRVNMVRHTVQNASYEGCRRGIVPGASADDVRQRANAVLGTVSVHGGQVTVEPAVIASDTPQVSVTVAAPLDQNGWITSVFFSGRTVTSSLTLAREEFETVSVP